MFPVSDKEYRNWRAARLDQCPAGAHDVLIDINGLTSLTAIERAAIKSTVNHANMAIYSCRDQTVNRAAIIAFGRHFGLTRLDHHLCANDDGVSELTVASDDARGGYVPYSNRSLSWHTDGYYNEAPERVAAVILHCDQDAESGGENEVLDPELAYIRLRDENPAFVEAFEHPNCMTIPANVSGEKEIRAAVSGPVFSFDGPGGVLHMRYSARKRNIQWRDDAKTTAARECLTEFLGREDGPVIRFSLKPGQGLISNNVLHNRTAFRDSATQKRLLYRARFFDRVDSS